MGGPLRRDPHALDMNREAVLMHWCPVCGAYEPVEAEPQDPLVASARPGRNEPCWCGSGAKYKRCHLAADEAGGQS